MIALEGKTKQSSYLKSAMTTTHVQPYLFFGGRCEEALDFYRTSIGAHVGFVMHYKDSPEAQPPGMLPSGFGNKVMHATFRIGGSTLMASDGCEEGTRFEGFSLSMAFPTEAEASQAFEALAEGGHVKMPLAKTFWSPCFGMVTDKFGIGWMVTVEAS